MFRQLTVAVLLAASAACNGQGSEAAATKAAGAQAPRPLRAIPGCEGCEAAWERDPDTLGATIALAPPGEPGEPLVLRGTIFKPDGTTPAPGVVIYIHQTNSSGVYANGGSESEWSRRHGRLRGWLKTGADGRYEVRTVKPGRYPDRSETAHIHLTVWEPGRDPYWIDDVVFSGEPGVDAGYRAGRENRGGSGIVRLTRSDDGRLLAVRDITLLK